MIEKLAAAAEASGKNNVAFTSYLILGKVEKCLDILVNTERIPEAALFARTYLPSQVPKVLSLWKEQLAKVSEKAAQSLADPIQYENLFPEYLDTVKAEQYFAQQRKTLLPANQFNRIPGLQERNIVEEMKAAETQGKFQYVPASSDMKIINLDEKEKPSLPPQRNETIFQSVPKSTPMLPPMVPTPAVAPVIFTPTPVSNAPAPQPPKSSMLPDEFLDPELDLELEGINLDGDGEDVNFDEDLLGDD
jgi:coatomer subunit beta'